jgi:hypothetical protein
LALPRSSHGQFVRSDLIVCRPPKLAEIGLYDVAIAVNGVDFCSDVRVVDIYQDPILHGLVSPQLYNAMTETGLTTIVLVTALIPLLSFLLPHLCLSSLISVSVSPPVLQSPRHSRKGEWCVSEALR